MGKRLERPTGKGRVSKAAAARAHAAVRSKAGDQQNDARRKPGAWTMMIYLAGDNNLSEEMIWALKEVYRTGTPPGLAVTLMFDPAAPGRPSRMYVAPETAHSVDIDGVFPLLRERTLGEVDTGDRETLVEFVRESIALAPAERYMLILSGHGSGIVGDFLSDDGDIDRGRTSLSIPDLRRVFLRLREVLPHASDSGEPVFDVLGMDSCLMSMAEVCSEIAGQVRFVVGSEGYEPNRGWPYFRFLQRLANIDLATLETPSLVSRLVTRYALYYGDYVDAGVSVDIAACDVSADSMTRLVEAVSSFVTYYLEEKRHLEENRKSGETGSWIDDLLVLGHWRAQSFKREQYTDLADFAEVVAADAGRYVGMVRPELADGFRTLATQMTRLREAVAAVVQAQQSSGPQFQHARGLSLYFPWSLTAFEPKYGSTQFAKDSNWHLFLQRHLQATQRTQATARRHGTLLQAERPDFVVPLPEASEPTGFPAGNSLVGLPVGAGAGAPVGRTTAPASRTTAPASRTTAPASRFADELFRQLELAPSTMKNPATTLPIEVVVMPEDVGQLGRIRPSTEVRRELARINPAGTDLLRRLSR